MVITPKRTSCMKNIVNNKKRKISKKTSGSGKIVFKPKPGEKTASNLIVKQQTPGTNVSVNPSGLSVRNRPGTITTNVSNTSSPSKAPRVASSTILFSGILLKIDSISKVCSLASLSFLTAFCIFLICCHPHDIYQNHYCNYL